MEKIDFVQRNLNNPQPEAIEDVSSSLHETNRIPDARILLVEDGEIKKPKDGRLVDDSIEKESYLGSLEYSAFKKIKRWATECGEGTSFWFSPAYEGVYPVTKIDVSEMLYSIDGKKVLLKRAVVLDIDNQTLMQIADEFAQALNLPRIIDTEVLRASPFILTDNRLPLLLDIISRFTNQDEMIRTNKDLELKMETYQKLNTIKREHHHTFYVSVREEYFFIKQRAKEEGLMGEHQESCPSGNTQTAFGAFSGEENGNEIKLLSCTCPFCNQRVNALVYAGEIHCPSCKKSAPYSC